MSQGFIKKYKSNIDTISLSFYINNHSSISHFKLFRSGTYLFSPVGNISIDLCLLMNNLNKIDYMLENIFAHQLTSNFFRLDSQSLMSFTMTNGKSHLSYFITIIP